MDQTLGFIRTSAQGPVSLVIFARMKVSVPDKKSVEGLMSFVRNNLLLLLQSLKVTTPLVVTPLLHALDRSLVRTVRMTSLLPTYYLLILCIFIVYSFFIHHVLKAIIAKVE